MPIGRANHPNASQIDPLILAAVQDVDDSLIEWFMSLSPRERLRACTRATRALTRFQRVAPQDR